jgi:hypothetical protein
VKDRPWLVVLIVFFVLGMGFGFLTRFFQKTKKKKLEPTPVEAPIPQRTTSKPEPYIYFPPPNWGPDGGGESKENQEFLQEMMKKFEERKREVENQNIVWLKKMINDTSLATRTREIYRLRLIPEVAKAHKALENNDLEGAMENFQAVLKDPNASPVTKYLCLDYMIDIARKKKNYELYFALGKQQGLLVKEEDLSIFRISKDSDRLEFFEEEEQLYKASLHSSDFDALVAKRTKEDPRSREVITREVQEDIKDFQERFNAD